MLSVLCNNHIFVNFFPISCAPKFNDNFSVGREHPGFDLFLGDGTTELDALGEEGVVCPVQPDFASDDHSGGLK